MKRKLCFLFIVISFIQNVQGQTVQVFPNPEAGLGYLANSVMYNNKLYAPYRNASFVTVMAVFDGNTTSLISNPDDGSSASIDNMLVYNGKLYYRYQNISGAMQLAQYDGATTTLIPNPDNSTVGYMGEPVIFNNKLYFEYVNAGGSFQLAQYDGVSVTLIPNPAGGLNTGYIGYPIVYAGNLYFEYLGTATASLAKFDGTTITLIPNVAGGQYAPINTTAQAPVPIIYQGKLYFNYLYKNAYCLAQYDGVKISVVPNPDFNMLNVSGYINSPVIYNDTLYVEYENAEGNDQLAKYNGTTLVLVANPDAGQLNPYGTYPVIYHCDLYLSYLNAKTSYQLARFDGKTVTLVPDPAGAGQPGVFEGYAPPCVFYDNKLFFNYNAKSTGTIQLAEYSDIDNVMTLLPNPAGIPQSDGPDIDYNSKLCVQYFNNTGVVMGELDSTTDTIGIPRISITAAPDSVCTGTPVTFTAHPVNFGLPSSYEWLLDGKRVGTNDTFYVNSSLVQGDTVRCVMTYTTPCYIDSVVSNNIMIFIEPNIIPSVHIDSASGNSCEGNPVTFTAMPANGGNSPSYQWQLNGVNVGTDSSGYTDKAPANGDLVNCIMTSDAGCVVNPIAYSDTISIAVIAPFNSSITISVDSNNICYGDSLIFTAVATNGGANPAYQWMINGADAGTNSAVFTSNTIQNGSSITCELSDSVGCVIPSTSDSIVMNIFPLPTVGNADTIIRSGANIILNLPVTGNIQSYTWSPPGGLSDPDSEHPSISLSANTVFNLAVITTDGCTANGNLTVDVFNALYIPSAFTPNNDGKNDIFRIPPSIVVKIKYFNVYDRWGKMIFSTTNASQGWDGTYAGQQENSGTYVWAIEYIDPLNNKVQDVSGTVVLIR